MSIRYQQLNQTDVSPVMMDRYKEQTDDPWTPEGTSATNSSGVLEETLNQILLNTVSQEYHAALSMG
jgi:hypothetical protein